MKRLLGADRDNTKLFRTLPTGWTSKNYERFPSEKTQPINSPANGGIRRDAVNIREFVDVVMSEASLRQDYPQHLDQNGVVGDTASIQDPRVVATIAWMQHQLTKGYVDIDEIAQIVNLSSSHLRHLFREQTGLTLHRYHKFLRLQRAHDLLSRSFLSVKQVMTEMGWTDESHFCRDYKRIYGSSPSKARSGDLKIRTKQPNLA